jgi:hypothetical protein
MKVAKFTLNGYINYGNVLQSYALQKFLSNFGAQVDSIWHTESNFLPKTWWQWSWKEPIKYLLNWKGFRTSLRSGHLGMEMIRQGKIKEWCDKNLNVVHYDGNPKKLTTEYDYFVVGSDQVWNPELPRTVLSENFLPFSVPSKNIAYAASIANPIIPNNLIPLYKQGLENIKYISVREDEAKKIINKITERDVPILVDPTLLLTAAEWRKVSIQPAWYKGNNFILTYFLGKKPKEIEELGKKEKMQIVNLLNFNEYDHYITGVDEFLWAIDHASSVLTDSFHGTVFSIIFGKPFFVFDRIPLNNSDLAVSKMSSRIVSLLKLFHLETRRVSNEDVVQLNSYEMPKIDINNILSLERERSHAFLSKILDGNK